MNVNRIPFKLMKATLAMLQTAVLMIVATLNIETLSLEHKLLATQIMLARDETAKQMKAKPPRHKLLMLVGAWYRLAEQAQVLVPDQPIVRESFARVMREAKWIAEYLPEVKS